MKRTTTLIFIAIIHINALAQTPESIIKAVKKAQQNIHWVNYTLKRTDTLLTGNVRSMTGNVIMKRDTNDRTLGFLFKTQLDESNTERIYDGHLGYLLNDDQKSYSTVSANNINHILIGGGDGGWLIMPDLVKIDVSRVIAFLLTQDDSNYYLSMKYPDYEPE